MKLLPLVLILLAGVNSCIGNLLLKWSRTSAAAEASPIEKLFSAAFLGGMFFYAVNVVLFAKALDSMEVSVAYPILAGAGFAFLIIASSFFFGETLTFARASGMVFILMGITLLARDG